MKTKRRPVRLVMPIAEIARDEADRWTRSGKLSRGLVMAILFAFAHRLTTGKTFEESFFTSSEAIDFQI